MIKNKTEQLLLIKYNAHFKYSKTRNCFLAWPFIFYNCLYIPFIYEEIAINIFKEMPLILNE